MDACSSHAPDAPPLQQVLPAQPDRGLAPRQIWKKEGGPGSWYAGNGATHCVDVEPRLACVGDFGLSGWARLAAGGWRLCDSDLSRHQGAFGHVASLSICVPGSW